MSQLMIDAQGKPFAQMGKQKGVTSKAWQKRQGDLMRVLDAIKSGAPIRIGDWTVLEALGIPIPALRRFTLAEMRAKYMWIRENDGIARDTSSETAMIFDLGTVFRPGEMEIDGDEYALRRTGLDGLLGLQHGLWLVEHQDEFPEFMALLGKVYIDLPGTIVVNADGDRCFFCLHQRGERWGLYWDWADRGLPQHGRVARART